MENTIINGAAAPGKINFKLYNYLDLGCSSGSSISYGSKYFGGTSCIGLDIDQEKIAAAQEKINTGKIKGRHIAVCADVLQMDLMMPRKKFRFATCVHFLEHVGGYRDVQRILFSAAECCTEFVYVIQPDFDKNRYLFDKKLKTYYSDWTSHTAQLTSYDFYRICKRFREGGTIKDFIIFQTNPIQSSSDPRIHSIDSPRNQQGYDERKHPAKPMDIPLEDVYENIGLLMIIEDDFPADACLDKCCADRNVIYDSRNIKNI